jgi:hypothetical protein
MPLVRQSDRFGMIMCKLGPLLLHLTDARSRHGSQASRKSGDIAKKNTHHEISKKYHIDVGNSHDKCNGRGAFGTLFVEIFYSGKR